MRIVHVVHTLDPLLGGLPAAALHMAAALASQNHEVSLVTTAPPSAARNGDDSWCLGLSPAVRTIEFPRNGWPYSYSPPLLRWLDRNLGTFDLAEIHSVFNHPSLATARRCLRLGVPFVLHPHGSLDPFDLAKHPRQKRALGRTLIRPIIDGAARVVVASEREGRVMETFGARAQVDCLGLPYRSSGMVGTGARFRSKYGLDGAPIVLFMGRVDYKKGLYHLAAAASRFPGGPSRPTIVVAGDASSDFGQRFARHVAGTGHDHAVRLVGHLGDADKADALAASSLLVLVSDNENYGLVLVEAARAGVPMVVSDEVYIAAQLVERGAAIRVDRDGEAIHGALRALLADPPRLARMSEAAVEVAGDLFDWPGLARQHSDLREAILARSNGSPQ